MTTKAYGGKETLGWINGIFHLTAGTICIQIFKEQKRNIYLTWHYILLTSVTSQQDHESGFESELMAQSCKGPD